MSFSGELTPAPGGFRRAVRDVVSLSGRLIPKLGILHAASLRGAVRLARTALSEGPSLRGPDAVLTWYASMTPEVEVLIDRGGERRLTWAALADRARRLAEGLRSIGVKPKHRIGVAIGNRSEFIETLLAAALLDAVTVPIGVSSKASEVRYLLGDSQATALVFDSTAAEAVHAAARDLVPHDRRLCVDSDVPDSRSYEALISDSRPLRNPLGHGWGGNILYTSGTTGKPKGAFRDVGKMGLIQVADFISHSGLWRGDRFLVDTPIHHGMGMFYISTTIVLLGGTAVINNGFEPEQTLATIERERITATAMVPTMCAKIAALPPVVLDRYETSSLRCILCGGSALPQGLIDAIERRFGPVLYNYYGATEIGPVTVARPQDMKSHPGTIGRVLFGNEVRLLDATRREVPVGAIGELWVRNGMLVSGYFRNDQATARSRHGDFFSVGDLASRDADGFYYFAGRTHDMVKSGGENIYPAEIEEVLARHPAVAECALVGVPDVRWGEALWAFVVLRPDHPATADGLREFCRPHLANFKLPKQVVFLPELPHNAMGKVVKAELQKDAQSLAKSASARPTR